MAFGKRSSKSTRSTNKTNSFKRFGEKEKPAKKQREDKPWAIYNPKLGVIFAKQNRRGDCYAAQVDPDEAEALVKAEPQILIYWEKGLAFAFLRIELYWNEDPDRMRHKRVAD